MSHDFTYSIAPIPSRDNMEIILAKQTVVQFQIIWMIIILSRHIITFSSTSLAICNIKALLLYYYLVFLCFLPKRKIAFLFQWVAVWICDCILISSLLRVCLLLAMHCCVRWRLKLDGHGDNILALNRKGLLKIGMMRRCMGCGGRGWLTRWHWTHVAWWIYLADHEGKDRLSRLHELPHPAPYQLCHSHRNITIFGIMFII